MLEVILVVAVLSIAMAIAVPGLVRLSRNLKIMKLDDIAKEIYTSAQSRTISLSVGGQLSQVEGADKPVPVAEDGSDAAPIKYVSNSGGASGTDMLLPLGSIEEVVRQNYYIIEYNPVTAAVKGVYYWENEGNDFLSEGYGKIDPTKREDRMNYSGGMVGYYGGEDVKRLTPPDGGVSSVNAELINDEELYLEITQGRTGEANLEGVITVTLTDLDTKASKELIAFENSNGTIKSGVVRTYGTIQDNLSYDSSTKKYKVTLDSLISGLRFSELNLDATGSTFHPGCELKVTVTFLEKDKQAWSRDFHTNSLFASVDGKFEDRDRTAYIACGRHLENLGLRFVYPGKPILPGEDLNGVKRAVQTKEIDWKTSLEKVGSEAPASFTPIVNGVLLEYNGKGNAIFHTSISGDVSGFSDGVGLFSRFEGDSLKNVKLVDCTVENAGSGSQPVGLLAGSIVPAGTNCTVSNCHAYADTKGSFNCSIQTAGEYTGGLFGSVEKAKMVNCSASLTKLTGGTYAGGLAGRVSSAEILSCYADTGVWSSSSAGGGWASGLSGEHVGGLLGSIVGSLKLEDSYAVGWASDSANVFGLVGTDGGSLTVQKCYAAVKDGDNIADLVPSGLSSAAGISTCINYSGGYDDFKSLLTPGGPYVSASAMTTHAYGMPETADPENPGSKIPPVYPFPRLKNMPHYGDWPQEGPVGITMAYYEVYQHGGTYSIGFYSKYKDGDAEKVYDSLKNDKEYDKDGNEIEYAVVMDGYAVMLPPADASAALTVTYNTVTYDNSVDAGRLMKAEAKFGSAIAGKIGTEAEITTSKGKVKYCPLFLSSAMMTQDEPASNRESYYQKLEVKVKESGKTLVNVYFNPYVAKSDFLDAQKTASGAPADPPAAPKGSILRTSRQVTAYSYDAMQKTAVGSYVQTAEGGTGAAHTLRLERNIDCSGNFKTDSTVSGGSMECVDLSVPSSGTSGAPNVILELGGKTLTGTGKASAVTSGGGILEVYGDKKGETAKGGIKAAMTGGDIPMISMSGAKGLLKNVIIDNSGNPSGMSVSMGSDVTLSGCRVIDKTADDPEESGT